MSILALTSDTLVGTPVSGQVEYNGQFYATDSAGSRAQVERLVLSTAQNTTSGASIDFTGIPAWAKRITVMFSGVSTSGATEFGIRLGTSSGFTATGYVAGIGYAGIGSPVTGGTTNSTLFQCAFSGVNTAITTGSVKLELLNSSTNLWVCNGVCYRSDIAQMDMVGGYVALSGLLNQIRITTVNGTDTFDAGSVNIMYEG